MPGCMFSHLASMTFCWLPPDKSETLVVTLGARILRRWRNVSAMESSAWRFRNPHEEIYLSSVARDALAKIGIGNKRPNLHRSSETKAMPSFIASFGV